MTIADYASRVLHGETLAEKLELLPLAGLEDGEAASPAPSLAVEPGRPPGLGLRPPGSRDRAGFPAAARLADEESRGRLFHFFANHELMAAELMALALLRFPGAPAAFRRGLARTMQEEQVHAAAYIERMRACGVEFGSHPLSRYFWDAVAPMENPLDYVTRLSLTFEQANLDYARHYAGVLAEAGDAESARLLERIYRDEIAHVGYGLKWFRRWKRAGQSDWDAYRGALVFPLSPSRAKGNGAEFNRAGRIEAGLDEAFIRELAVFERSKGRAPDIFWFNPDAEDAMAAGLSGGGYQPRGAVEEFLRDLELLPMFLCRRDDVVLARRAPRREHLERLQAWGFPLPEFEVVGPGNALAPGSLVRRRRLRALKPWAWEPRAARLFAPLRAGLPAGIPAPEWTECLRQRFSKAAQAARWPWWHPEEEGGPRSWPVPGPGEAEQARREAEALLGGSVRLVWKPAFAAAGRGFRWKEDGPGRGPGVLEPWVERAFDFSVQYEMTGGGLRQVALVRQIVDAAGRWRGSAWQPKFCGGLEPELARHLMEEALPRYAEGADFPVSLERWLDEAGYRGPVGVDAFLYRGAGGELRHRVACEVNPRWTMGRLAWELSRKIAPGRGLRFTVERKAAAEEAAASGPVLDRRGLARGGTLVLTDMETASAWAGVLRVGEESGGGAQSSAGGDGRSSARCISS